MRELLLWRVVRSSLLREVEGLGVGGEVLWSISRVWSSPEDLRESSLASLLLVVS